MKNLIYALALLISFSSFGQEYGTSSITNFSPELDKCSTDFMYSDNDLLEHFLDAYSAGDDQFGKFHSIEKNIFRTQTVRFEFDGMSDIFNSSGYTFYSLDSLFVKNADEFIEFNSIDDEELGEIIDDIKADLFKISWSSKKISGDITYNGCEIESINSTDNRGRKKNHYVGSYNSTDNILNIVYVKNNKSETIYLSENGGFKTAYLDGVKDYTEEMDVETQMGKYQSFYLNGNLMFSGKYDFEDGPFGSWIFYSKNGKYSANADLDDKGKGKIKDSAEIYKSGVFLKKVRLKNKRKGKLLDLLNELDSDN
jgi:hypothetical protein